MRVYFENDTKIDDVDGKSFGINSRSLKLDSDLDKREEMKNM